MCRLILSIVLFLLSLLLLFRAPTNLTWKLAVALIEFPYILMAVSLALFVSHFWAIRYKPVCLLLSAITFIIACLPVIRAYARAGSLEKDFPASFPSNASSSQLSSPFSFWKMFTGIGAKDIEPQVLTYKQHPGKSLALDFYSAGQAKAPCVIVIHGGSWASGDSKQLPALNSYLAARGCHVAAINYRLAPDYKSPAPVEDTQSAIDYLVAHAEELHIDTSSFILLGRSAGAQIALVAAYTLHDARIKGAISYYGPVNLFWGAHIPSNKLVLNTDQVFRDYLGGLVDEVPQKYHEADAWDHASPNSVPTLLIHGPIDPMVAYGHSERLDKKLDSLGAKHYFLNLPWATHGCDYNINGPSGQLCTYAVERFIHSVTTH